jgi:hypothetical protein
LKPWQLYDALVAALKSRPQRNLSTSEGFRLAYADTVAALASCGIKLTATQVQRCHWSDEIKTLWDEAEYILERHFAQRGLRVVWPNRGEQIRVVAKRKA